MEEVISSGISRKKGAFEKRIHEIDFLRGFLMCLVIMDHIFWCLKHYNGIWFDATNVAFFKAIFQIFDFYWKSNAREIVRVFAIFGFCFVSGVSSAFSKNNWKRAGQMILVAGVIAVGSNLLDSYHLLGSQVLRIDFNVIAVLAWSTLFYCFVQDKSWRSILVGCLSTLLIAWYLVPWLKEINDVHGFDAFVPSLWLPSAAQADWLPLFPYMLLFFLGALFSYFFYKDSKVSLIKKKGNWERPFCFMGRHSLIIYLAHQFVMTPIFILLTVIITGKGV